MFCLELAASSKYRSLAKSESKRRENFLQSRQKLNKSRNDYLLSLQALTHYRYKLFNDDIPALFENLTCEFYVLMKVALRNLCQAQVKRISNSEVCNEKLEEKVMQVDFGKEWSSIYDSNSDCLDIPDSKLEFLPAYTKECLDSINSLQLDSDVKERYPIIMQNFDANLMKSRETQDQIEAAKRSIVNIGQNMHVELSDYLLDLQNTRGSTGTLQNSQCDEDAVAENGGTASQNGCTKVAVISSEHSMRQSLVNVRGQYNTVVSKFRELFGYSNKAARLKARKDLIESTFGGALETTQTTYKMVSVKRQESVKITKYVPRPVAAVNVKLFGGDIEQYCKAIQKDIPPVVLSCIEFIREHGMFTQGIFRVNGAKSTVRYLKDYFEGGDDPLLSPSADSNAEEYEAAAVSELLKLYFRQLQVPALPTEVLKEFIKSQTPQSNISNDGSFLDSTGQSIDMSEDSLSEGATDNSIGTDSIKMLKNVLSNLPYSTMVTLRYLFAFLNSLTRFSDENMMDSYNLSIVWGPTLVRPDEEELVAMQTPITQLVQFLIVNHFQVFPQDSGSLFSDTASRIRPRTLSIAEMGSTCSLTDSIETTSPYSQNDNNNSISYGISMSFSPTSSQSSKLPTPNYPKNALTPSSDSGESLGSSDSPALNPKSARHIRQSSSVVVNSAALISQPGEVVKEASVLMNRMIP